jgi:hypothetical protein
LEEMMMMMMMMMVVVVKMIIHKRKRHSVASINFTNGIPIITKKSTKNKYGLLFRK